MSRTFRRSPSSRFDADFMERMEEIRADERARADRRKLARDVKTFERTGRIPSGRTGFLLS